MIIAGCGGSSSGQPPPTYSIGGTVTGLSVGGLVLSDGAQTLAVSANQSSFTFSAKVAAGTGYVVAIQTQPAGALCYATNGNGTVASTNITNIGITCGSHNFWISASGDDSFDSAGNYGTINVSSAANIPAARALGATWTDQSGNLWLFGGETTSSLASSTSNLLNDLWRYSPATSEWTWVSGDATTGGQGMHAGQGVASSGNLPSARISAETWVDAQGSLWLYSGAEYDATGLYNYLTDLWKYEPASNLWTWEGDFAAATDPGARINAMTWTDSAGTFWMFSGDSGVSPVLADLWSYSPSSGVWSLASGSNTTVGAPGVYGTQGTPVAGNVPGARQSGFAHVDGSGNLWIYGGIGIDAAGNSGILSDLWSYSPATGLWTWMSGSNMSQSQYQQNGVVFASAATTNWFDSSENVWMFGGSFKVNTVPADYYNLVDEFQSATGQIVAIDAPTIAPLGRDNAMGWTGADGTFWLFGGYNDGATVSPGGEFNGLWRYIP